MSTTDLHVLRRGSSGERIVMVHGSFKRGSELFFGPQMPLAEQYRLLIPHRRNYGLSPGSGQKTFAQEAQDLLDVIGEEPAHLLGVSYGGVIALLAAAKAPDRILSLTVSDPPAFSVARGQAAVETLMSRMTPIWTLSEPAEILSRFYGALGINLPVIEERLTEADKRDIVAGVSEPLPFEVDIAPDVLAGAVFPRMVFAGGWHPAFDTTQAHLAAQINAELVTLAGRGHNVHYHPDFNGHWRRVLMPR
ncbi:MAG: alpha/beta hydrolase [Chloroflexota bacterium]